METNQFGLRVAEAAGTSETMTITCDRCKGEATKVSFQDTVHALIPGDTLAFDLCKKRLKGGAD